MKTPRFLLLVLLTAFAALSTDMYLPAIPTLQRIWNQPAAVVNLTLIGFFVTFCFALLVYGPDSDRWRPATCGCSPIVDR